PPWSMSASQDGRQRDSFSKRTRVPPILSSIHCRIRVVSMPASSLIPATCQAGGLGSSVVANLRGNIRRIPVIPPGDDAIAFHLQGTHDTDHNLEFMIEAREVVCEHDDLVPPLGEDHVALRGDRHQLATAIPVEPELGLELGEDAVAPPHLVTGWHGNPPEK